MTRSTPILKVLAVAAFVAALTIGGAGVAGAQATSDDCINLVTYEATATIGATPATTTAGQVITVSGSGFPANYELKVFLNGTEIRKVTTDASGSFSFPYTTTAAEAGRQLRFTVDFCNAALSTAVTVSSTSGGSSTGASGGSTSTGSTGSSSLPATGSDSADLARIGVLLVAGGALAIAATRRRNQSKATA